MNPKGPPTDSQQTSRQTSQQTLNELQMYPQPTPLNGPPNKLIKPYLSPPTSNRKKINILKLM